jgi:hypothetical protein
MKRIKLYISLLFTLYAPYGFGQCITNPEFITSSNCTPTTCYFDDGCVTNWHRSHGTPQYHRNTTTPSASYMYMWATHDTGLGGYGPHGEGIWGGFTFLAYHQYKIKVAAYNAGSNGDIVVLAANNVPTTTFTACQGENLPSVTGTAPIMQQFLEGGNSTFTEYTITFTPTANYTQVWVYPTTWANNGDQMDLYVDYVSICEEFCTGTIVYNSGAMPGGETRAGFIWAGSSSGFGGSGTVTAQNGITTSLIGGEEVTLQPNFHVQLTSGEFRALIYACSPQQRISEQPSKYPSVPATLDPKGSPPIRGGAGSGRFDSLRLARVTPPPGPESVAIYPNPVRSKLNVQLNNFTGAISGIQVLNEVGVVVQQIDRKTYADKQKLEIDVSKLPDGMFILRVVTDKQTFTQKFQKLK